METTTIEIKTDVWAALDRRKQPDESFDSVIRRLIDATPVGVGELAVEDLGLEYGDVENLIEKQGEGKQCCHYDIINGESCPKDPLYRQEYKYPDEDSWNVFYYCEEHKPEQ